ncbi:thioredoxin [Cupriavidus sp. SK-3]|uniref:thioredoxin n=1 Tax=Cupriavidus sp. SK-3 TaxID=1470558 RepID=UPI0004477E4E|nr:thioredoxin [Cupriavidus sp. SK-3]KDP85186.1 thioredoxin [Cupriavidus sp. SK-3]
MSTTIKHVSDATFEADVLQADRPVLVDFWAEWCGPCRMVAPVLEQIAKEQADTLLVAKVDVDVNKDVSARFGIRGIPALILFKNGKIVGQKVGALSKSKMEAFLGMHV